VVREEVPDPWAGGHHDHLCVEIVERLDARLLLESGAVPQCAVDEGSVREVGADDAGLGLEEHRPPLGHADRPTALRSVRVEQFVLGSRRRERVCGALCRAFDDLEQAVELE